MDNMATVPTEDLENKDTETKETSENPNEFKTTVTNHSNEPTAIESEKVYSSGLTVEPSSTTITTDVQHDENPEPTIEPEPPSKAAEATTVLELIDVNEKTQEPAQIGNYLTEESTSPIANDPTVEPKPVANDLSEEPASVENDLNEKTTPVGNDQTEKPTPDLNEEPKPVAEDLREEPNPLIENDKLNEPKPVITAPTFEHSTTAQPEVIATDQSDEFKASDLNSAVITEESKDEAASEDVDNPNPKIAFEQTEEMIKTADGLSTDPKDPVETIQPTSTYVASQHESSEPPATPELSDKVKTVNNIQVATDTESKAVTERLGEVAVADSTPSNDLTQDQSNSSAGSDENSAGQTVYRESAVHTDVNKESIPDNTLNNIQLQVQIPTTNSSQTDLNPVYTNEAENEVAQHLHLENSGITSNTSLYQEDKGALALSATHTVTGLTEATGGQFVAEYSNKTIGYDDSSIEPSEAFKESSSVLTTVQHVSSFQASQEADTAGIQEQLNDAPSYVVQSSFDPQYSGAASHHLTSLASSNPKVVVDPIPQTSSFDPSQNLHILSQASLQHQQLSAQLSAERGINTQEPVLAGEVVGGADVGVTQSVYQVQVPLTAASSSIIPLQQPSMSSEQIIIGPQDIISQALPTITGGTATANENFVQLLPKTPVPLSVAQAAAASQSVASVGRGAPESFVSPLTTPNKSIVYHNRPAKLTPPLAASQSFVSSLQQPTAAVKGAQPKVIRTVPVRRGGGRGGTAPTVQRRKARIVQLLQDHSGSRIVIPTATGQQIARKPRVRQQPQQVIIEQQQIRGQGGHRHHQSPYQPKQRNRDLDSVGSQILRVDGKLMKGILAYGDDGNQYVVPDNLPGQNLTPFQVVGGVTPGTFKTAPVEVTPPPQQQQQSYAAAATSFVAPASVIQCVGGQQTSVIQSNYATTTAENREASSAFELLQSELADYTNFLPTTTTIDNQNYLSTSNQTYQPTLTAADQTYQTSLTSGGQTYQSSMISGSQQPFVDASTASEVAPQVVDLAGLVVSETIPLVMDSATGQLVPETSSYPAIHIKQDNAAPRARAASIEDQVDILFGRKSEAMVNQQQAEEAAAVPAAATEPLPTTTVSILEATSKESHQLAKTVVPGPQTRARPASAGIIVAKRTTLPDPADTPAIFPDPADTPADTMDDRLPLNVVSAATSASAELSGSGLDQDPTSTNSDKIKSVARVKPFSTTGKEEVDRKVYSVLSYEASGSEVARKISKVKCQCSSHAAIGHPPTEVYYWEVGTARGSNSLFLTFDNAGVQYLHDQGLLRAFQSALASLKSEFLKADVSLEVSICLTCVRWAEKEYANKNLQLQQLQQQRQLQTQQKEEEVPDSKSSLSIDADQKDVVAEGAVKEELEQDKKPISSDPGCSRLADSSQIFEEEAGELASPPAQIERVEETKHEDVVNADMNKKKTGSSETIDVEAESSKPEECISNKDEHNIKSPTPLPADEKSSVPRSPLSTAPSAVDTSELKLGTKPEANAAILSELKPRARRERRRSSENPLENIYKKVYNNKRRSLPAAAEEAEETTKRPKRTAYYDLLCDISGCNVRVRSYKLLATHFRLKHPDLAQSSIAAQRETTVNVREDVKPSEKGVDGVGSVEDLKDDDENSANDGENIEKRETDAEKEKQNLGYYSKQTGSKSAESVTNPEKVSARPELKRLAIDMVGDLLTPLRQKRSMETRNAKEEDAKKPKKQKLKSEKTSMYDDIDDGTSCGVVTESLAGNLDNKQADIPIAKSEAAIKDSGHERPEAVIVDEIEEDLEQLPSPEHSEDKVKSQEKTEEDSKAKHDTPEPEQSTKEDLPEKSVEKERPKRSLYREKLLKSLNIDMVSDTFSPLTSRRRRNKNSPPPDDLKKHGPTPSKNDTRNVDAKVIKTRRKSAELAAAATTDLKAKDDILKDKRNFANDLFERVMHKRLTAVSAFKSLKKHLGDGIQFIQFEEEYRKFFLEQQSKTDNQIEIVDKELVDLDNYKNAGTSAAAEDSVVSKETDTDITGQAEANLKELEAIESRLKEILGSSEMFGSSEKAALRNMRKLLEEY